MHQETMAAERNADWGIGMGEMDKQKRSTLQSIQSTMGKQIVEEGQNPKTKAHRLDNAPEISDSDKNTWPADAVVYLGHLPYGFQEQQLTSYFSQYGDVLGVKVARSKKTARSKGYAFIQFRYPEVATVVSDTMNGYLLLGKVIVSHVLGAGQKNPFLFGSSHQYKFINWKRLFIKKQNEVKTEEQTAHIVDSLIRKEQKKKQKLKELGIQYLYPGFLAYLPAEEEVASKVKTSKKDKQDVKVEKTEKKVKAAKAK